jgi:hypothetical protein
LDEVVEEIRKMTLGSIEKVVGMRNLDIKDHA